MQIYFTIFFLTLFYSCKGQEPINSSTEQKTNHQQPIDFPIFQNNQPNFEDQIGEYVVEIFEDSKNNLWFGTMAKGVARYDGKTLTYFTTKDGLSGHAVVSIVEDKAGNIWLGTHSGLSKYDGKTFTNFTTKDGLCHNRVSKLLIDQNDVLWIGTWAGVCQYKDSTFSNFALPKPDMTPPWYQETMNWVTAIVEDQQGNIWFGRSGYGACKYNGTSFTHFTKKEGLLSNCVQTIREDPKGNIWFGTRIAEKDNPAPDGKLGEGGLSRYDGKKFIHYSHIEGLTKNDIYEVYKDKKGNIWVGASGVGVYKYDSASFKLYKETDRTDLIYNFYVQSMLEDSKGMLWLGCSGGLFRLHHSIITNVTQNGPWKL